MYRLQILTPEEIFFDDDVISLIAPGSEGYLGILTNHAPLITLLKPGILIITGKSQNKNFYKISKGFLQVDHNKASLLIESIQPASPVEIGSPI